MNLRLLFCAGFLSLTMLASPTRKELDARSKALLSQSNLAAVAKIDPLLSEYLSYQKRIIANIDESIQRDPENAPLFLGDWEYLVSCLEREVQHARTTPIIDETKYHNVRDFGAKADGVTDDGPALTKAIAAAQAGTDGKRTVFLPKGRYLVCQQTAEMGNIQLDGFSNIRIVGENGSEIVLPKSSDSGVRISNSDNVGLKNLRFSCLEQSFMTGVIIALPDTETLRIKRDPGMPSPLEPYFANAGNRLMRFFSAEMLPDKSAPALSNYAPHQGKPTITQVSEDVFDFRVRTFTPVQKYYKVGMRAVYFARESGNSHTIFNVGSQRTRLENLEITASSSIGIVNWGSYRPFIVNCRIVPREGRFISTCADGIYMRALTLGGLIRGNLVRNIGDDFTNIHTFISPIDKVQGSDVFLRQSDWHRLYIYPGVRLGLLRLSKGENRISESRKIVACKVENGFYHVTLDKPFGKVECRNSPLPMPDMVVSLDLQAAGSVIVGNRFEHGSSRILCGGRDCLYMNNTYLDSSAYTFFANICPEGIPRDGDECALPCNIEISNNHFITYSKTLFRFNGLLTSRVDEKQRKPGYLHIKITDNVIDEYGKTSSSPLFDIAHTDFLTITGNTIHTKRKGNLVRVAEDIGQHCIIQQK